MMQLLIPIFMGLLIIVTSKTEPIDLFDDNVAATGTIDHRYKMLLPSRNMNDDPYEFSRFKTLAARLLKLNLLDDGRNEPQDWNGEESSFEPNALTSGKILDVDDIVDDSFDHLDETSRSMDDSDEFDENYLNQMYIFVTKLLRQPIWQAPLVIINEPTFSEKSEESELKTSDELESRPAMLKRSHYWRQLPWDRQKIRPPRDFEYAAAHICQPARHDVYHLLVALHDVRQGKKRRRISFCKQRNTARWVLSNVRFIGRRK